MLNVIKKLGIVVLLLAGCSQVNNNDRVCFGHKCVDVEVVEEKKELMQGLQHRTSLEKNSGMLFIFQANYRQSFWMKDTLIPLDIIWLDYGQRIVHIETNVPPCITTQCPTYAPDKSALYVLEVNAQYSKKLGIKIGDRADFTFVE